MTVKIVYGISLYTIFFAYSLFIVTIIKDKFYFDFIHYSTISTFNDDFTTKSLLSHSPKRLILKLYLLLKYRTP